MNPRQADQIDMDAVLDSIHNDLFICSYVRCLLWSETMPGTNGDSFQSGGHTLDSFDWLSVLGIWQMCHKFRASVAEAPLLDDPEHAGADLWLTQNGHGAGFWDGDWPEPTATMLTEAAKRIGPCEVYLGDDDRIYIAGYETSERLDQAAFLPFMQRHVAG